MKNRLSENDDLINKVDDLDLENQSFDSSLKTIIIVAISAFILTILAFVFWDKIKDLTADKHPEAQIIQSAATPVDTTVKDTSETQNPDEVQSKDQNTEPEKGDVKYQKPKEDLDVEVNNESKDGKEDSGNNDTW